MAEPDGQTADAPDGQAPQQHRDEVTGEMVSKTELKRRQKQRAVEEKKRAKAATAPPSSSTTTSTLVSAQKKVSAEEPEEELNPNQVFERRSELIKKLKEGNGPSPYPHEFSNNTSIRQFLKQYSSLKRGETLKDIPIGLEGRIITKRSQSSKLVFYNIRSGGADVQIMCQLQEATGPVPFEEQHEHLSPGDIVGIIGFPGRTAPNNRPDGELSVFAQQVILTTPCLRIFPSPRYGFSDPVKRQRQRYLDFTMNEKSMQTLKTRSKILAYIRRYFDDEGFCEVETPTMNTQAGGATAKPFKTHLNDLHMDLFMRVAPELWLKTLLVGGFERVMEIGVNYRNEANDLTHSPAFTSCEFYEAGTDLYGVMKRTEELLSGLVQHIHGSQVTKFHTQTGKEYEINWAGPWKRIKMIPALEEACGEDFPPGEELHTAETGDFLKRMLVKMNVECGSPQTNARMIDKLVGDLIEDKCINPTFITETPQIMSPLAKYHREKPGLTERAELFVATKELANMYTEQNDPVAQRRAFEEQTRQKDQGDEEAQPIDEDFILALDYGLPRTGGWGMGIDRLVMLLTDHFAIREVQAFPIVKPGLESTGVESTPAKEDSVTENERLLKRIAMLEAKVESLEKEKAA